MNHQALYLGAANGNRSGTAEIQSSDEAENR
jgi:hypothetical protein